MLSAESRSQSMTLSGMFLAGLYVVKKTPSRVISDGYLLASVAGRLFDVNEEIEYACG